MPRIGQPPKLTPKTRKAILNAISKGASRRAAAQAAGIGKTTLMNWLHEGRREGGSATMVQFVAEVEQAEAQAAVAACIAVQNAWSSDWRSAAWFLERRYPQEWGRRAQVDLNAKLVHTPALDVIHDPVASELAQQLFLRLAANADQPSGPSTLERLTADDFEP
jgi:transposase